MASRRPLVFGNWKMNGTIEQALPLIDAMTAQGRPIEGMLAVFPPFTLLEQVARRLDGSGILLGAQDCHQAAQGAFTGSISAPMIKDCGADAVILGHSERRHGLGETDALVLEKANAALVADVGTIVICIGETEDDHVQRRTLAVLRKQIEGSIPKRLDARRLVLAYEPVWAIGSGRTPSAEEVAVVHAELRRGLVKHLDGDGASVPILYGGSVKAANAAAMLTIPDVDGALVGGASLDGSEFIKIFTSGGGSFAPLRS